MDQRQQRNNTQQRRRAQEAQERSSVPTKALENENGSHQRAPLHNIGNKQHASSSSTAVKPTHTERQARVVERDSNQAAAMVICDEIPLVPQEEQQQSMSVLPPASKVLTRTSTLTSYMNCANHSLNPPMDATTAADVMDIDITLEEEEEEEEDAALARVVSDSSMEEDFNERLLLEIPNDAQLQQDLLEHQFHFERRVCHILFLFVCLFVCL